MSGYSVSSRSKKRKVKWIIFSLLPLVFLLLFVEILLRVIFPTPFLTPDNYPGIYVTHPKWGHDLAPRIDVHGFGYGVERFSRFVTNNYSFIRSEDTDPRDRKIRRTLVLGDSHLHGVVDYRDNLTMVAERKLNANGKKKYEILNGGVGVFSLYQEFLKAKHLIPEIRPERVVILTYLGNDALEMDTGGSGPVLNDDGSEPNYTAKRYHPKSDVSFETVYFRSYNFLKGVVLPFFHFEVRDKMDQSAKQIGLASYRDLRGAVSQSRGQARYFCQHPERIEICFNKIDLTVKKLKELAGNNIEVLFLLLPSEIQIQNYASNQAVMVADYLGIGDCKTLRFETLFMKHLEDRLTDLDIPFINFLSLFQGEQVSNLYWFDGHIDIKAHRLIGEVIADYIIPKSAAEKPGGG